MTVLDLIIKLQNMPPNMEVIFDATSDTSDMFKLVSIDEVEEIKTPEGTSYIMLSCGLETLGNSLN